jgi:hypothetical protein
MGELVAFIFHASPPFARTGCDLEKCRRNCIDCHKGLCHDVSYWLNRRRSLSSMHAGAPPSAKLSESKKELYYNSRKQTKKQH